MRATGAIAELRPPPRFARRMARQTTIMSQPRMPRSGLKVLHAIVIAGVTAGGALLTLSTAGLGQQSTQPGASSTAQTGAAKSPPAAPPAPVADTPPAPVVTVSRPVVQEVIEWDEYTGRFDAVDTVDLRARVSGYLTEVHFKDGQVVAQGDLLFTIDARPFERTLEQARAELALAQVRVENAARDVDRGRPLVDRKIMSEKVFDDRENAKRDAEAQVKVAEAKVKTAELDLAFTRITAPTGGRIGRNLASRGSYIVGGSSGTPTLLTTIVTQDPIHLYFDISENNHLKYKRLAGSAGAAGTALGTPVTIALPDEQEQGFPHAGVLDFIDNRLDQGTGTLRARAVVDNKAGLFSPGMFARVRLAGSAVQMAMLLPDAAVGTDQSVKYVIVVGEDGVAQRRVVTLGPLVGGLRVVRDGITADSWVVVNGLQRARPGAKVAPKREQIKVSQTVPELTAGASRKASQ